MNYLAILAGAISIMVLGFIWFHPKVFGTPWMKGAKLTDEDMKNPNPMVMVGALLMAVALSYYFSRYASHPQEGMSQFVHGMYHGFMPGIMIVVPVIVSKSLFEMKSLGWIAISAGYWLLALTLCSGLVYAITPVAS